MMNKRELKEALTNYYTGKEAEDYDYNRERKDVRRYAEVKKQIENTLTLLEGLPEKEILDVACGTGRLFHLYGKRKIYGVDISEDMLKQARKKYPNAVLKIADAENIPYEDNRFDIIITAQFIQHLPEYINGLKEMVRVCKKGGYIIVDFPNKHSLIYLFREIKRKLGFVWRPYNCFSKGDIKKIAEELGLEIIDIKKTIVITPLILPKSFVKFSEGLNNFLIKIVPFATYKNYVLFRKKY